MAIGDNSREAAPDAWEESLREELRFMVVLCQLPVASCQFLLGTSERRQRLVGRRARGRWAAVPGGVVQPPWAF